MEWTRILRYLAPNLVTFSSLTFGLASIVCSFEGRYAPAAWFIMWSVLADKLDGFVARLLKASTEFGVQLDSLADFLNFGVAPAVLVYAFLTRASELPFVSGFGSVLVMFASLLWVFAVTFRLARYNVVGDDPRCRRIFFGVPTTLMGGVVATYFLTCLKYSGGGISYAAQVSFDEPRFFGNLVLPKMAFEIIPHLMIAGALLMASTLKIPKLGLSKSKALSAFILVNVGFGYLFGFGRKLPEYLVLLPMIWIVSSILWGLFSSEARSLRPPPLIPKKDRPASQLPQRPEEDALPDEDDAVSEPPPPAPAAREARAKS